MSRPMSPYEPDSLQYNFFMAFAAMKRASLIRSNNTGPAADKAVTSEEDWWKLTHCIDKVPGSVRVEWGKACGDLASAACLFRLARLAEEKGCGNCQEKVAVAMLWLIEQGVRPLDLMELETAHGIDHAFAVIGRRSGGADDDQAAWGPNAVVCDPWHDGGKVLYAANLQTMLYRGNPTNWFGGRLRPHSVLRIE